MMLSSDSLLKLLEARKNGHVISLLENSLENRLEWDNTRHWLTVVSVFY